MFELSLHVNEAVLLSGGGENNMKACKTMVVTPAGPLLTITQALTGIGPKRMPEIYGADTI